MSSTRVDQKVFERTDFGSFGWIAFVPENIFDEALRTASLVQITGSFRNPLREHTHAYMQLDQPQMIIQKEFFVKGFMTLGFASAAGEVTALETAPSLTFVDSRPRIKT